MNSDPQHIKARLQRQGAWSQKSLGQHFLLDLSVVEAAVQAARLQKTDTVVEIGPGLGVLTERLLQHAGRVIVCEYDPHMQQIMQEDFPEAEMVGGDVLRTGPEVVAKLGDYKVVANIPYQITTPLLKLFLEGGVSHPPVSLTLLVQKEVGKRLAAEAKQGDRGYLSVVCQYFATVHYLKDVPARAFWPAPKVDSALIHLEIRPQRALPLEKEEAFLRFTRSLFRFPRKQLHTVLEGTWRLTKDETRQYIQDQGLSDKVRAQELSVEQWITLFNSRQ